MRIKRKDRDDLAKVTIFTAVYIEEKVMIDKINNC